MIKIDKTVKRVRRTSVEHFLSHYGIKVSMREMKPHPARKLMFRGELKGCKFRANKSVYPRKVNFGCEGSSDEEIIETIGQMIQWKYVTLPCGKEVGPIVLK